MLTLLVDSAQGFAPEQQHILSLARLLREEGAFLPHICCPAASPLAEAALADALPWVAFAPEGGLISLMRLWLRQRRAAPLLVHSFSGAALQASGRLARLRRADTTLRLYSCAIPPVAEEVQVPVWLGLDRILCADAVTRKALSDMGMESTALAVAHPALDTAALPPCGPRKPHADGRFVFAALGPLDETGGMETLLAAMARLRATPDTGPWEVRVAGEGPRFQALLDEALALEIADLLALLGQQPVEEILPLCDAVIVPAVRRQGQWAALAAAWAVGLPLICSRVPTHMELARAGRSALAFTPGDAEGLAEAMRRLIQDEPLRGQLRTEGALMRPHMDIARLTRQCADIYAACAYARGWLAHGAHPASGPNLQPPSEEHEM